METKDKIEQILRQRFNIQDLRITDDSAQHHGHKEARKSGGGHFSVLLVSDDFVNLKLIERHRLINAALKDLIPSKIHALAVRAFSKNEYCKD
ncbi:MAG: BolA family transcriptional regulator [Candidatus Omnitrophica bacterium]|nr:BolA family transcriptional regulator [Candidatus Omnitrophota bacterium]